MISQLDADLVSISNASYINFEGIKFSESRESGIVMNNCSDINVSDYEVSNIGKNGVMINNCKNIVFDGGKIYNIARVGFNIAETINNELTESGNILKNSEVYRCSRASGDRDNTVINNFFYNCKNSLVMTTHWGVTNDKYHAKDGTDNDNVYYRLIKTPYLAQLKKDFPGVQRILDEYDSQEYPDNHPEYPKNNVVYGNVVYSSRGVFADENVKEYGNITIDPAKDVAIYK